MKKLIIFFAMITTQGLCEEKKFPVEAIPTELKENADVVVREKDETFVILDKDKARYTVHEVYTIFNTKGKSFSQEVISYSKLQKIVDFKGAVYDEQGNQIRKLKSSEIYDQSAISGFSLYEDNRLKAAELGQGSYPYTVEFDYVVDYKFLFYIPAFHLVDREGVAVENSTYSLSATSEFSPRYKLVNTDQKPRQSEGRNGQVTWKWSFKNEKAYKREPLGPDIHEMVPTILAGPSRFEFENYSGTMDSWDNFGRWINTLNYGRHAIPETTRQKIADLTKGLSVEEKINLVYEYLQNKTRYVSIQIGIGGYQPFDAKVVDETGYGDCKALSNYTVSLLEAAGVKANYVLIRAGRSAPQLVNDFPSTQFNHAVVAVPNGLDTIWLECTSQTNPFGYMGTFTGDRTALMITENGAKVVNTPIYKAEQNIQSRTIDVFVEATGDAKAKVKTTYSGLQYENDGLHFVLNNQYDDQKKWIQKTTSIPSFDLTSFSITNRKGRIPLATVEMNMVLRRYASVSGKRMFITPNLMNRSTRTLEKMESRKTNVVNDIGFVDLDTSIYHLPDGIYPEFIPAPVKLKSIFGEYEASFKIDQGSLVYIRRLKMSKGDYPPETYNDLVNFYKGVNKADNIRIVFLSKT